MKRNPIPPHLPPQPAPIETDRGLYAGRVLGTLSACVLCGILLTLFFMAFLTIPREDYAFIFIIGAGVPLLFSFPLLSR